MSLTVAPPRPFLATNERTFDRFSVSSECSVIQAAEFLDMSAGCVEELLDAGVLTFRFDGEQRWVKRDRLLEYGADYREGLEALAELSQISQEMGLYDCD